MKITKRQLRRILRESTRRILNENVCYDGDAIWDQIEDNGQAYAPRNVAEDWMFDLHPRDRKNMTLDTRITIMIDDQGNECECVKIEDMSFRGY